MYSQFYAERMMDMRSRETAEIRLNLQRVREATATHDAPRFYDTTLPVRGEARMLHSASRRSVRLGRVMISW